MDYFRNNTEDNNVFLCNIPPKMMTQPLFSSRPSVTLKYTRTRARHVRTTDTL